jgi:hypothetical protein
MTTGGDSTIFSCVMNLAKSPVLRDAPERNVQNAGRIMGNEEFSRISGKKQAAPAETGTPTER